MKDKIPILGKPYKVSLVDQDDPGTVDFTTLSIKIKKDMPKENISETLLHEVLEAINGELELALTHPQICALSVGLASAGVRI